MSTIPALTPEMRQALDASGGLPADLACAERLRRELDRGTADIDAGRLVDWDPERIKREGRERLARIDATSR
jgi:hypothetical protein